MPTRQQRPPAALIAEDRSVLNALREMPNYNPPDANCSIASLEALDRDYAAAEQEEQKALRAYNAARARLISAGWALHEGIVRSKTQVIALFGDDSQAVQDIGLTKRSQRKRPSRRPNAGD